VGRAEAASAADANERSEDNFCSMNITQEVQAFPVRHHNNPPGEGAEIHLAMKV
jgi:hypothetical protein